MDVGLGVQGTVGVWGDEESLLTTECGRFWVSSILYNIHLLCDYSVQIITVANFLILWLVTFYFHVVITLLKMSVVGMATLLPLQVHTHTILVDSIHCLSPLQLMAMPIVGETTGSDNVVCRLMPYLKGHAHT